MERITRDVYKNPERRINLSKIWGKNKGTLYSVIGLSIICIIWYFAAKAINRALVLPDFAATMKAFFTSWTNPQVMSNLLLTLRRVFTGLCYSIAIGLPLGLAMGYSRTILEAFSPLINSIRQVPVMAWVPLSIIWFGLGDGPTIFLITMSAVFPVIINTMSGVAGIEPNYIHAAKSMGAGLGQIFKDIILPGAFPNFLVGCRMALGLAWMSVICAEFIATSEGFGFIMIDAQLRMQTPLLYALMIMSAVVGYLIDRILLIAENKLTSWRFKDGASNN